MRSRETVSQNGLGPFSVKRFPATCCLAVFLFSVACSEGQPTMTEVNVRIDGAQQFQRIDGFGVNANSASWNGQELKPAIDLLTNTLRATIWRVVVETERDWEDKNDDGNPFVFNWTYYRSIYEKPKFQKVWDLIAYLNHNGMTDGVMINLMGRLPAWMGREVIKEDKEDEWVEMVVSLLYYARNVRHLKFGIFAPMNEPNIRNEGPTVSPQQYVRVLKKLIQRLDAVGLDNIRIVAPDVAGMGSGLNDYMPKMMADAAIMSRVAHFGLHSYSGQDTDAEKVIKNSPYADRGFWMTEWNAWRNGLDNGQLGVYDYQFASECVRYLLQHLEGGATAALVWEAYDSVYEHPPSTWSLWGTLGFDQSTRTYSPRKHFYAIAQVSKFVPPGSRRIGVSGSTQQFTVLAFHDKVSGKLAIVGESRRGTDMRLKGELLNLPNVSELEVYYTSSLADLQKGDDVTVQSDAFSVVIPAECIFTLAGAGSPGVAAPVFDPNSGTYPQGQCVAITCATPGAAIRYTADGSEPTESSSLYEVPLRLGRTTAIRARAFKNDGVESDIASATYTLWVNPEAPGWYAGDMHVHRSGGGPPIPVSAIYEGMSENDVAVVSLLADMGNGEVKDPAEDLPRVNGSDDPVSEPGRLVHWDAEWHYDPVGWTVEHKVIGGHVIALGLTHARTIPAEYTYPIFDWARKQNAVTGLAHLQYLEEGVPQDLDGCAPLEYPVEAALGACDFVSEDVDGNEHAIHAYYRLLNCGFRPGLAAGTDYSFNFGRPIGDLLTYVRVQGDLTYRKWIEGIARGRTIISRNGHNEFLELKASGNAFPGDETKLTGGGTVEVNVKWTARRNLTGTIELVANGSVVALKQASVTPDSPAVLSTTVSFSRSGWLCARRMGRDGHQAHTAAVFAIVDDAPIRASADDANFFLKWIDNLLEKTSPGGAWSRYFPHDREAAHKRYRKAREIFERIATEAQELAKTSR